MDMLDGLVLQVVLMVLVVISAVITTIWFVGGITKKSATLIVALSVPFAVVVALLLSLF
jgi:hypothetical protein